MSKKTVFRVGDYLQLHRPEYVFSCGYETNFTDILWTVYKECAESEKEKPKELYTQQSRRNDYLTSIFRMHEDFAELRKSMKPWCKALNNLRWTKCPELDEDIESTWYCEDRPQNLNNIHMNYIHRLVKDYVYMRMSDKIMRGNKRILSKEILPKALFDDVLFKVIDKKVVQTGTYYPPETWGGYDEPYEYIPGGLAETKTHVLLFCCMEKYDSCRNTLMSYYPGGVELRQLIMNGKLIEASGFYCQAYTRANMCWFDRDDCYHVYPTEQSKKIAERLMTSA